MTTKTKTNKKFKLTYVSPIGDAYWPHITSTDSDGEFADDKYKTGLVIPMSDEGAIDKLKALCDQVAVGEWGSKPDDLRYPFSTITIDGEAKYIIRTKTEYAVKVVDTKRNPLGKDVSIWGGDVIRFQAQAFPYKTSEKIKEGGKTKVVTVFGVSLGLTHVQLIEKRSGGGHEAAFDDIEGYTYEGAGTENEDEGDTEGDGPDF